MFSIRSLSATTFLSADLPPFFCHFVRGFCLSPIGSEGRDLESFRRTFGLVFLFSPCPAIFYSFPRVSVGDRTLMRIDAALLYPTGWPCNAPLYISFLLLFVCPSRFGTACLRSVADGSVVVVLIDDPPALTSLLPLVPVAYPPASNSPGAQRDTSAAEIRPKVLLARSPALLLPEVSFSPSLLLHPYGR